MICQPTPKTDDSLHKPAIDSAGTPAEARLATKGCVLSKALLADGEIVILELKPSLWFIPLVSAPLVGVGLVILLVAYANPVVENLPSWHTALSYVGTWIIALRLAWAVLEWFCRLYVLTDRRIIRQRGVLTVQVFECRLDRLQNTFVQQTLVQRLLNVGNIYFATAGTGLLEAAWQHVRNPGAVHKEIVETASRFQKLNKSGGL